PTAPPWTTSSTRCTRGRTSLPRNATTSGGSWKGPTCRGGTGATCPTRRRARRGNASATSTACRSTTSTTCWPRCARCSSAAALEDYVALCGRGGSAPFRELARSAGLRSPFDDGCLADVVAAAREVLG